MVIAMALLQFWGLPSAKVRNSSCKSVHFYYAEHIYAGMAAQWENPNETFIY
jgi:hypothetical protein